MNETPAKIDCIHTVFKDIFLLDMAKIASPGFLFYLVEYQNNIVFGLILVQNRLKTCPEGDVVNA